MDPFSPFAVTGLNPGAAPATTAMAGSKPAVAASAGPSAAANSVPYHPDHPLFWLAALVAVTFGLIGANSAIRVGKFKAALSAGTT